MIWPDILSRLERPPLVDNTEIFYNFGDISIRLVEPKNKNKIYCQLDRKRTN